MFCRCRVTAVNAMDVHNTMPTSSASVSCASLPASSSSRAMAHAMENVRSPPNDVSVPEATPVEPSIATDERGLATRTLSSMVAGKLAALAFERKRACTSASAPTGLCAGRLLTSCADLRFIATRRQLTATREMIDGGSEVLELRHLFLGSEAERVCGRRRATSDVVRKKKRERLDRSSRVVVDGVIFGTSMGHVLQFARVESDKRSVMQALREIVRFLGPARHALQSTGGELARVLGSHRVHAAQAKLLFDSYGSRSRRRTNTATGGIDTIAGSERERRDYARRSGARGVALGAVASTLCAHHLVSRAGARERARSSVSSCAFFAALLRSLREAVRATLRHLQSWPFLDLEVDSPAHADALRLEIATAIRADAASEAAERFCKHSDLSPDHQLDVHMEMMRDAAFAPTRCDLPAGARVLQTPMPLSALPAGAFLAPSGDAGIGSSDDESAAEDDSIPSSSCSNWTRSSSSGSSFA